jgi:hypothetical protein
MERNGLEKRDEFPIWLILREIEVEIFVTPDYANRKGRFAGLLWRMQLA